MPQSILTEVVIASGAVASGFGGWRFISYMLNKIKALEKNTVKRFESIERIQHKCQLEVATHIAEINQMLRSGKEAREKNERLFDAMTVSVNSLCVVVGRLEETIKKNGTAKGG